MIMIPNSSFVPKHSLASEPAATRNMDYWEISMNFVDNNPHGNDKRRTSQQCTSTIVRVEACPAFSH